MICSTLMINKKLVDYKLSNSTKDLSDFSNSLVRAGYPFWHTEGVEVSNIEVAGNAEAMNMLIKIPFAQQRAFDSLTSSVAPAKAKFCWCCGYYIKARYHFCPICGEKIEEE